MSNFTNGGVIVQRTPFIRYLERRLWSVCAQCRHPSWCEKYQRCGEEYEPPLSAAVSSDRPEA
jgi:hypothetical protein